MLAALLRVTQIDLSGVAAIADPYGRNIQVAASGAIATAVIVIWLGLSRSADC